MDKVSTRQAMQKRELESASFIWRNGRWLMQADKGGTPARALRGSADKFLDQMLQQGELVEQAPGLFRLSTAKAKPFLDCSESPLQRLSHLKQPDGTPLLDREQVRAGERLRVDYERAHLAARVTASYDASQSLGAGPARFSDNHIEALSDTILTARNKVHLAMEAVGPELSGILLHVCCMASGLEQAELNLALPRRAGKAVMQLALTRLARHYGYKSAVRHAGPSRIGHWAVSDFKPEISALNAHRP